MRRLTTVNDSLELGDYDWSPDGSWLLFTAGSFSHHDVWIVAADGSDQHPIAASDANEYGPVWSPDGRRIAYVSDRSVGTRTVISETLLVDVDGSHPTVVGRNIGVGLWAPDGRSIVGWKQTSDGATPTLFDVAGKGDGQPLLPRDPVSWQRLAP